jgi:hypothetical protein
MCRIGTRRAARVKWHAAGGANRSHPRCRFFAGESDAPGRTLEIELPRKGIVRHSDSPIELSGFPRDQADGVAMPNEDVERGFEEGDRAVFSLQADLDIGTPRSIVDGGLPGRALRLL